MNLHEFLKALHGVLAPRTYVETGIQSGSSLALSRASSVGIDPEYKVVSELVTDVHLARTTSDEFFARSNPLAHLPVPVVDLALIDGMHLAEYALRDYLAIERFTTPASVVVFDDMLPRSVDEAARHRHTRAWTGDVFKAAQALRTMSPQPIVVEVDTAPTGVAVVLAPYAGRDGAWDGYDDWLDVALAPDPQAVPAALLNRTRAIDPAQLLASSGWRQLVRLRNRRAPVPPHEIRAAFADVLA